VSPYGRGGHGGLGGHGDGYFSKFIISELVAVMDNKDESVFCGKGVKDLRGQVKYKGETPKSFLQQIHLKDSPQAEMFDWWNWRFWCIWCFWWYF
jgi:hypothetical protein